MADSDRLKAVNAPQVVRNNKSMIDQMVEGAGKMDRLVNNASDLLIDSYQSYNKTASMINAITDSNKKLPVFALEPWDSLKPKNKKISKDDFNKVLEDYGLGSDLSDKQQKELYNKLTGG
jgi:predicted patatin/cPLA2 family phospholipase